MTRSATKTLLMWTAMLFSQTKGYTTPSCVHELSSPTGAIMTPQYPRKYPKSISCVWTIKAEKGHYVQLTFLDFDVEPYKDCLTDQLEIKDGGTINDPLIGGQYCNTRRPPTVITSTNNQLRIWFLSDSTVQYRGFKATYKTMVDEDCGGDINAVHGEIASPRFPLHYPRDRQCHWRIKVPAGKYVSLKFLFFEVESTCPGGKCSCLDTVTIKDGHANDARLIGTYCLSAPPPLMTSGNELALSFSSDEYGRMKGFKAIFTQSSTEACGGDYQIGSGTIESPGFAPLASTTYEPFLDCLWTLSAPVEGEVVSVRFLHLDVAEGFNQACYNGDFVEVRDGGSRKDKLIGYYCNSNIPEVLVSSGKQMFIRFHSDASKSGSGFQLEFRSHEQSCHSPLGVSDGRIPASQLQSSSSFEIAHEPNRLSAEHGRLDGPHAWCSQELFSAYIGEYFQIEFREFTEVTAVATQGYTMVGNAYFTTKFKIMYSTGNYLQHYVNEKDVERGDIYTLFRGNTVYNDTQKNDFRPPIISKRIRIVPLDYISGRRRHICLRAELYGCTVDVGDSGAVLTKPSAEVNFSTYKKSISTWVISPDVEMRRPVYTLLVKGITADCSTTRLTLSFDGTSASENTSYCDKRASQQIILPLTRQMWITFEIASTPVRFQGVNFEYNTEDLGLGRLITTEHGIIHGAHHFLAKLNATSTWIISLPIGCRINIELKRVSMPKLANGSCDSFLLLRKGLSASSPVIRKPICGEKSPSSFVHTWNTLRIEYHPGQYHANQHRVYQQRRQGFKLKYSIWRDGIKTHEPQSYLRRRLLMLNEDFT